MYLRNSRGARERVLRFGRRSQGEQGKAISSSEERDHVTDSLGTSENHGIYVRRIYLREFDKAFVAYKVGIDFPEALKEAMRRLILTYFP